ncbi:MAG: poly-gamma-glutamate biosynthesis protein PgsC [Candidatus Omnitrophica bacterium]|nr:poly-gamma-glutamate biosynthesis protein PgsC [Candidatus Omnitrophota bacterium]
MVEQAIGVGLIINLIFFELFGLPAGGMVIPGYLALQLQYPWRIAATLSLGLLVYLTIKLLSNFMFIYGRRHLIMALLFGFLLRRIFEGAISVRIIEISATLNIIGYIVPGLIAYWMERQGVVRALSLTILGAVLTRLILIILLGGRIIL